MLSELPVRKGELTPVPGFESEGWLIFRQKKRSERFYVRPYTQNAEEPGFPSSRSVKVPETHCPFEVIVKCDLL